MKSSPLLDLSFQENDDWQASKAGLALKRSARSLSPPRCVITSNWQVVNPRRESIALARFPAFFLALFLSYLS